MLYLSVKYFCHQVQLLVSFRMKEVYMYYIFLTTNNINRCNVNVVYARTK
jgi:hypothetical protein